MTKEYLREFREMKRTAAINGDEGKIAERQAAIEKVLGILPPIEKAVIMAYYCRLMTWAQVAEVLHYEERQIYRLHGKVLKKLSEIVGGKE